MINSSRANLSLDLFLQNDSVVFSSTSTFHLCISLVYFTVRRGDLLNLPKFYRASSVSWRAPTGKWQWLTDQSERAIYFCYVIIVFPSFCRSEIFSVLTFECRLKRTNILWADLLLKGLLKCTCINFKELCHNCSEP